MAKQRKFYNIRVKFYFNGTCQYTTYSKLHCRGETKPINQNINYKVKVPLNILVVRAKRIERSSAARAKNMIYDYARANTFEWFVTLTFNPDKVNSFDYNIVVKKLGSYLDRIRRKCPNMKYIIVPELHKSGRYHFHGLFGNCNNLGFMFSGFTTLDNNPIYNIGSYKLGFTTATRITDNARVNSYISKYITKDLLNHIKGKKRFWHSQNLQKPKEQYILIKNLNDYDFKKSAKYHKEIEHYSPESIEYINYYEYEYASNEAVKGLPKEATTVNP